MDLVVGTVGHQAAGKEIVGAEKSGDSSVREQGNLAEL